MRILIVHATRRGSTAELGRALGAALHRRGHDIVVADVTENPSVDGVDAVVIGSAIYRNRWLPAASSFVNAQRTDLLARPVWLFSSGPLDESADTGSLAPLPPVMKIAKDLAARGHRTFGGRFTRADGDLRDRIWARGRHGDFRNQTAVEDYAWQIASALGRVERASEVKAAMPRQRKTGKRAAPKSADRVSD